MLNFLRMTSAIVLFATLGVSASAAELADPALTRVAEDWAALKYRGEGDPERMSKTLALEQEAAMVSERHPEAAEPLYWEAQVLCLTAELMHSWHSLDKMRRARALLEKAEKLDPGSSVILAQLGSVYYEVPGWPIAFGNKGKARTYLQRALDLAPDGVDANYFMGDFLLQEGHHAEAIPYLEKALAASGRVVASPMAEGRHQEIAYDLDEAWRRVAH